MLCEGIKNGLTLLKEKNKNMQKKEREDKERQGEDVTQMTEDKVSMLYTAYSHYC